MINNFDKEYAFLSNFYPSPIPFKTMDGRTVMADTVEHYFQAAKAASMEECLEILAAPTPGASKKYGRRCQLRSDWEQIKDSVMEQALRLKFSDIELKTKLLATGDEPLEEGTWWHDNEWGNCYCDKCANIQGKNKLGKLLMKLREEYKNED